ncbi:MAG: VCBS repeat-containing protein [Anaerolineae bacterium]|nr:VCBS repeat-containing protein [Anaerolineae bacterium]
MKKRWLFVCCLVAGVMGVITAVTLTRAQTEPTPYQDVTTVAGINSPRARTDGEKITGQAWGDYDQDGWLDLYVTDTDGLNTLYRNNGNGTFSVSSLNEQVALPDAESGGAIFADYDNDGWPDLLVLNWGPNVLFHNEQGQGFVDVTAVAGVAGNQNSKTAAWGDYNGDGYLDLYVANWACDPRCGRSLEGEKDAFYRNNRDGTFSDVTNLLPGGKTRGAGFVASFVDFDNDGDLDIYLVNDEFINPVGNALWRNDGPYCLGWCFTEISAAAGADTRVMGMGLATGDYDNDGNLDFYFSNAGPMTLLQNQGDGTFGNVAEAAGVRYAQGVGWGAVFLDYDNDGWQDLYLSIMEGVAGGSPANPLFHNNGDGTFTNLGESSGAANPGRTIGVAAADYDQDGWVDLIIGNYDTGYFLYRNMMGSQFSNNWLTLKLVGSGYVNRDAVGARVTVTDSNGRNQMQEVKNGSSLGSGDWLDLHFGLGTAELDEVRITWPDGQEQVLDDLALNQRHTITYQPRPLKAVVEEEAGTPTAVLVGLFLLLATIMVGGLVWWRRKRV